MNCVAWTSLPRRAGTGSFTEVFLPFVPAPRRLLEFHAGTDPVVRRYCYS